MAVVPKSLLAVCIPYAADYHLWEKDQAAKTEVAQVNLDCHTRANCL